MSVSNLALISFTRVSCALVHSFSHRVDGRNTYGVSKKTWEEKEALRMKKYEEIVEEAGKLKKLIKQLEHTTTNSSSLDDVIAALKLVKEAMARVKTAFANVKKYWHYVRQ